MVIYTRIYRLKGCQEFKCSVLPGANKLFICLIYFLLHQTLLYKFLKIFARLSIHLYCRKLVIDRPEFLSKKGPLLLAANHPNSFLDSVIIDTLFKRPVWSLARGDVFTKPLYVKLLTALKILPVYRTSEGVENLSENYKTFEDCLQIFKEDGIITIFSEGKCINEWHLRPLKKGTARLAMKAWESGIPLQVLPVGINYSSFSRFGKNVFIHFGDPICTTHINLDEPDGYRHLAFNQQLEAQLKQLVWEIPKNDLRLQKQRLDIPLPKIRKIFLFLPALIGAVIHAPIVLPIKTFTRKRTRDNDHYDSVMVGLLFFAYPLYLLAIVLSTGIFFNWYIAISLLILLPFTAWSFVQLWGGVQAK